MLALSASARGLVSGLVALRVRGRPSACSLLAWAVLEFLHEQSADPSVDGVLGLLLAAYCAGRRWSSGAPTDEREPPEPRRHAGSHAA